MGTLVCNHHKVRYGSDIIPWPQPLELTQYVGGHHQVNKMITNTCDVVQGLGKQYFKRIRMDYNCQILHLENVNTSRDNKTPLKL